MDRNSKIFLVVAILLLIVSISLAYYRFFITKDFEIINNEESSNLPE